MKKKVYLLLFLILSLFIFSGEVEAAKELTCIYNDGLQESGKMLVQNSDGELFVYIGGDGELKIDNPKWYNPLTTDGNQVEYIWNTNSYNEDSGLSSCPSWSRYDEKWNSENYTYTFYFYDKKGWRTLDYRLVSSYDYLPSLNTYITFYSEKNEIYKEEIDNTTDWIAKCIYGTDTDDEKKLSLYFNENKLIIYNEDSLIYSSKAKFTLNELLNIYNEYQYCPIELYEAFSVVSTGQYENFFASYYLKKGDIGLLESGPTLTLIDYEHFRNFELDNDDNFTIENCDDLLGPDLVNKLNEIMNLVKMVIPILLIGFGIIDFTKAVFAANEETMAKSKKTFFRRIIAAILVFILPIFVNLLLSLANNVWNYINPNTCIK